MYERYEEALNTKLPKAGDRYRYDKDSVTYGDIYIICAILAASAVAGKVSLSEVYERYEEALNTKLPKAGDGYRYDKDSVTYGDIYILCAVLASSAVAGKVSLSEVYERYEKALKTELPTAGDEYRYGKVTYGDFYLIKAVLAGAVDQAMATVQVAEKNPDVQEISIDRRQFLKATGGFLVAFLGGFGWPGEATAGRAVSSVEQQASLLSKYIQSQIYQETKLITSFVNEQIPEGDPSIGTSWMYNQGQAILALLLAGDYEGAQTLTEGILDIKQEDRFRENDSDPLHEGKGYIWFNGYEITTGRPATKDAYQKFAQTGSTMAVAHALLEMLRHPQTSKEMQKKIVKEIRDNVFIWIDQRYQTEKDADGTVLGFSGPDQGFVDAYGAKFASGEYSARVMAFYGLVGQMSSYFTSEENAKAKERMEQIKNWIQRRLWSKEDGRYYEGYKWPDPHHDPNGVPAINKGPGSPTTHYINFILPICANVAGLDPKEFTGGLDYLLKQQVSVKLSDGEEVKGISRKTLDNGKPVVSVWAKGTGEMALAFLLDGRIKEARVLAEGLLPLIRSSGGVLEAFGQEGQKWPDHFPVESIEGAAVLFVLFQSLAAIEEGKDIKDVLKDIVKYDAAMGANQEAKASAPVQGPVEAFKAALQNRESVEPLNEEQLRAISVDVVRVQAFEPLMLSSEEEKEMEFPIINSKGENVTFNQVHVMAEYGLIKSVFVVNLQNGLEKAGLYVLDTIPEEEQIIAAFDKSIKNRSGLKIMLRQVIEKGRRDRSLVGLRKEFNTIVEKLKGKDVKVVASSGEIAAGVQGLVSDDKFMVILNEVYKGLTSSDAAMKAPGGIDLNAQNMGLDVSKGGKGIEMNFDPAMIAEFRQGNFTGVEGIILRIVPLPSPLPILGLE